MRKLAWIIACTGLVAGCSTYNDNAPLIFGSANTLGVSVSSVAAGQAPELTVGFREVNFISTPTIAHAADGTVKGLTSTNGATASSVGDEDTYSAFASFDSTAGTTSGVGIGTVFATGPAARIVACGDKGKHKDCSAN